MSQIIQHVGVAFVGTHSLNSILMAYFMYGLFTAVTRLVYVASNGSAISE
jgi:hypothetical protein